MVRSRRARSTRLRSGRDAAGLDLGRRGISMCRKRTCATLAVLGFAGYPPSESWRFVVFAELHDQSRALAVTSSRLASAELLAPARTV